MTYKHSRCGNKNANAAQLCAKKHKKQKMENRKSQAEIKQQANAKN